MIYARKGRGDVCVIGRIRGPNRAEAFECVECPLVETRWVLDRVFGGRIESVTGEPLSYATESRAEMVAHLQRHRDAGHDVPHEVSDDVASETTWGKP